MTSQKIQLTLTLQANGLFDTETYGLIDPYFKIYHEQTQLYKSEVVYNKSENILWKSCTFSVNQSALKRGLWVKLWDKDYGSTDDYLGKCELLNIESDKSYSLGEFEGQDLGELVVVELVKPEEEKVVEEKESVIEEESEDLEIKFNYNTKENAIESKTFEYDICEFQDTLVLRRGNKFNLTISGIDTDIENEPFQLNFYYDDYGLTNSFVPVETNDTKISLQVGGSDNESSSWSAVVDGVDEENGSVTVTVDVSVDAIIGKYKTSISYKSKTYNSNKPFYIIYNPYSPQDRVYMENQDERQEYVESDTGLVYYGTAHRQYPSNWLFGQFEPEILDACLQFLLRDSRQTTRPFKNIPKLRFPHYTTRVLTNAIMEFVLIGNWSGDYEDGKAPTFWNGSVKIIKQALETKNPVKYGQCWVFSGVTTTLCRTLGIPTRSVTNFESAHDSDETMTIDKYRDIATGGPVDDLESDSVWNFHVWAEVWMSRQDLKSNFDNDGWQAIDATPQEESFGKYQCGPCPLKAIKEGRIDVGYEAGFVFGEVNADTVTWSCEKDEVSGRYRVLKMHSKNTSGAGKHISTKSIGSKYRNDITNEYKYPEGTDDERNAFKLAYKYGRGDETIGNCICDDVEKITIAIDVEDNARAGNNVTIKVELTSNETSSFNYSGNLYSCKSVDRGEAKPKDLIDRQEGNVELTAGEVQVVEFEYKAVDYFNKLQRGNAMQFSIVVKDENSNDFEIKDLKFVLPPPDDIIGIFINGGCRARESMNCSVEIKNPFEFDMENTIVTLEGSRMGDVEKFVGTILAGETKNIDGFELNPKTVGLKTLLIDIDCDQIKDIKGFYEIEIE